MTGRGGQFGTIETLPSGKYRARYWGPDGQRYAAPVTFTTRQDARAFLSREAADISRGKWRPPHLRAVEGWQDPDAGPLFSLFAAQFHEELEISGRTRYNYDRILAKHLAPTFGNLHLAEIKPEQVEKWFRSMRRIPTERARSYERLAAIMKHAVKRGHIPSSPCSIKGGASSPAATPRDIATTAEVEQMTKAMVPHLAVVIPLGSWCALRVGEIRELRRRDIDLERRQVRVRRAVSKSDDVTHLVGDPKGHGKRDVTVPANVWPIIVAHLDEWVGPDPDALLIHAVGDPTRHLNGATLWDRWDEARTAAGRRDLRFHDLRHTGLTWTARIPGVTLKEIMRRGGHSTVSAAMRYQEVAQGRDRAIADALSTINLD